MSDEQFPRDMSRDDNDALDDPASGWMHIRWFGDPWPNEERRAVICESDEYNVPMSVVRGRKCLECTGLITETDRGVITGCTPSIWGSWRLKVGDAFFPVCSYHLKCWLDVVIGGELSAKIMNRMRLNPGDIPLTAEEIDHLEEQGPVSFEEEDAERGRGWKK